MTKTTKIALFLLAICLFALIDNVQGHQKTRNSPSKEGKHHGCLADIEPVMGGRVEPVGRKLQESSLHGFKILGEFPEASETSINLDGLKKIFRISAKYYQTVLRVPELPYASFNYPFANCYESDATAYNNVSPDHQSKADLVIFVSAFNDPNSGTIAYAGVCYIKNWPIYGTTTFNLARVETNAAKTGLFHQSIQTTLHEIAHILGLNSYDFGFSKPNSNFFYNNGSIIPTDKVISVNPNDPKTYVFILPSTQQYIQQHFGCGNDNVGAVLAENGYDTNNDGVADTYQPGSHWHGDVFRDEMMIPYSVAHGSRITELTLHLFQDSGYYAQVDTTLADPSVFGKGKGCDFALGTFKPAPEFCDSEGSSCGFYYLYGGSCSSGNHFLFNDRNCRIPEYSGNSVTPPQVLGTSSKCIDYFQNNNNRAFCLNTECVGNQIHVTVEGTTYVCANGGQRIEVSGSDHIICPDFERFCTVKTCENWCNGEGVCIDGVCILEDCSAIDANCRFCSRDSSSTKCDACADGFSVTSNGQSCSAGGEPVNCLSITACKTCSMSNGNLLCDSCFGDYALSDNKLSCALPTCISVIPNCKVAACQLIFSIFKCSDCNGDLVGSQDSRSCVAPSCTIANCDTCQLSGTDQNCATCLGDLIPAADGESCIAPACTIVNCTSCILDGTNQICDSCDGDLSPAADGESCISASCSIANCEQCSGSGASQACTVCKEDLIPSGDAKSCVSPACSIIINCNACSLSGTDMNCDSCDGDLIPSLDGQSCIAPACMITNCNSCGLNGTAQICLECAGDFIPSTNGRSCKPPTCDIGNCTHCFIDGADQYCEVCSGDLIPSANGKSCITPSCAYIDVNCDSCSLNQATLDLNCDSCSGGLVPSRDGEYCEEEDIYGDLDCSLYFSNCNHCDIDYDGYVYCLECSEGYGYYRGRCRSCRVQGCLRCDYSRRYCDICAPGTIPVYYGRYCF